MFIIDKIYFSEHAKDRMKEPRQKYIEKEDVRRLAKSHRKNTKGKKIKLYGFSKSNRPFSIVFSDKVTMRGNIRNIVTVVGGARPLKNSKMKPRILYVK